MALTTPEILGGGALIVSISGYLWNRFMFFSKINDKIAAIDARLAKQELKMDLFWPTVGEAVKNMLKQPSHIRKDELIDKFPNLDKYEICELKDILRAERTELVEHGECLPMEKKVYLIALVLMLANIDTMLVDRRVIC